MKKLYNKVSSTRSATVSIKTYQRGSCPTVGRETCGPGGTTGQQALRCYSTKMNEWVTAET